MPSWTHGGGETPLSPPFICPSILATLEDGLTKLTLNPQLPIQHENKHGIRLPHHVGLEHMKQGRTKEPDPNLALTNKAQAISWPAGGRRVNQGFYGTSGLSGPRPPAWPLKENTSGRPGDQGSTH